MVLASLPPPLELNHTPQAIVNVPLPSLPTFHFLPYLFSNNLALHGLFLYQQPHHHVEVVPLPHCLQEVSKERNFPVVRNMRDSIHKDVDYLCDHSLHRGGRGSVFLPGGTSSGSGGGGTSDGTWSLGTRLENQRQVLHFQGFI